MSITTKIVKDGNSQAVRLPKALLALSGLHGQVQLEAKKGQIIIKQSQQSPRADWEAKIIALQQSGADPMEGLEDLDGTSNDGLNDAAWEGDFKKDDC